MARLFRPHIPLKVRCKVAERQLRERDPEKYGYVVPGKKTAGNRLRVLLPWLAKTFGCEVSELRLDHDPPLAARRVRFGRKYIPDANDPAHLAYRPHGPEHAGSHLIKTNVRGDHGQHPDRVLIKKARRLERGPKPKRPTSFSRAKLRSQKQKWPKRKFEKRRV
jgi:hypothetical protein